jgi:hypothetical protein
LLPGVGVLARRPVTELELRLDEPPECLRIRNHLRPPRAVQQERKSGTSRRSAPTAYAQNPLWLLAEEKEKTNPTRRFPLRHPIALTACVQVGAQVNFCRWHGDWQVSR